MKTIMATFRPQAWVNDYAVEIDGKKTFDATAYVLAMTLEKLHKFKDCTDDADGIWLSVPESDDHSGPFEVEAAEAICAFFGVDSVEEITQEMLDAAKAEYAKRPKPAPKPVMVSVDKDLLFALIAYAEDDEREDFFEQIGEGNLGSKLTEREADELVSLEEDDTMRNATEQARFTVLFEKAITSEDAKNHVYYAIEMLRRQAQGTHDGRLTPNDGQHSHAPDCPYRLGGECNCRIPGTEA